MRIAVIPDVQVRPGRDWSFLRAVGNYIAEKQPEVVVQLGDFADMASLSSFDKGKKQFEGRRVRNDVEAVHAAMGALLAPIRRRRNYKPQMHLTLGNHEARILRVGELAPELDGLVNIEDLRYTKFGWKVHPFLKPLIISGVVFCHYLVSGPMARPITTAAALLTKRHMSAVVGHQQGLQIATAVRADGVMLHGVICGSCYLHNEDYLGPQANNHFRGMLFLNDVRPNGEFDLMPLSLRYLTANYA